MSRNRFKAHHEKPLEARKMQIVQKSSKNICRIEIRVLSLHSQNNDGAIAQLVEQRTENPCVTGSIPVGTTSNDSGFHLSRFSLSRISSPINWQWGPLVEVERPRKPLSWNFQSVPVLAELHRVCTIGVPILKGVIGLLHGFRLYKIKVDNKITP